MLALDSIVCNINVLISSNAKLVLARSRRRSINSFDGSKSVVWQKKVFYQLDN